MALLPQTSPTLKELLALGMARVGTSGEIYGPDGTLLGNLRPQGAAVADAAGGTTTGAEFNALLASLRAAGVIAT